MACEDDIDTEGLQAQIDLSLSSMTNLISSWIKPSIKASLPNSNQSLDRELDELTRRPPRLGLGALLPGPGNHVREIARLKGKITDKSGAKRKREEEHHLRRQDSEDEESRAGAIRKTPKVDSTDGRVRAKKVVVANDTPAQTKIALHSLVSSNDRAQIVHNAVAVLEPDAQRTGVRSGTQIRIPSPKSPGKRHTPTSPQEMDEEDNRASQGSNNVFSGFSKDSYFETSGNDVAKRESDVSNKGTRQDTCVSTSNMDSPTKKKRRRRKKRRTVDVPPLRETGDQGTNVRHGKPPALHFLGSTKIHGLHDRAADHEPNDDGSSVASTGPIPNPFSKKRRNRRPFLLPTPSSSFGGEKAESNDSNVTDSISLERDEGMKYFPPLISVTTLPHPVPSPDMFKSYPTPEFPPNGPAEQVDTHSLKGNEYKISSSSTKKRLRRKKAKRDIDGGRLYDVTGEMH